MTEWNETRNTQTILEIKLIN